ncbi:squalene/phytoene synthase family protein [Marivibrio halodurans]|uniref:Squalene/phytoene synthase family protein n=1 Tax=Marivibrio halodurans TaxID=2039722 RepID=A0A8J7RZR9_9PROT|nr:squalene/phytoene synthase family protein [Marivibrio halodurans]
MTRDSGSNLDAVGRFLPGRKRALFEACYASMRIVDDFVDDGFLAMDETARAAARPLAIRAVARWCARCEAALAGRDWRSADAEDMGDPLLAAGAAPVHDALLAAASTGAPGSRAWRALAEAMARDVAERAIAGWADFDAYCEGATVAPAAVFLHVLTMREERGRLVPTLSEDTLFAAARPMALFCYLVHIQRDLAKDTARGGQLVTLPADRLAVHGLTRAGLAEAMAAREPGVLSLAAEIHRRAGDYRAAIRAARDRVAPSLGRRERAILTTLIGVYERLHDRMADDPGAVIDAPERIAKGVVAGAFTESGLDALGDVGPEHGTE